jgi:hypothetical protein
MQSKKRYHAGAFDVYRLGSKHSAGDSPAAWNLLTSLNQIKRGMDVARTACQSQQLAF